MSQNVNRPTSAGYAVRTPDPSDRRKVLFSTTTEGAEIALAARVQRHAWLDAQLGALTREDQDAVARACVVLTNIACA
jgi:DNA-binding MarR family transcriptional regulator